MAHALRARILHFLDDPAEGDDASAWQYFDDGLLLIDQGRVVAIDHAQHLLPTLPAGIAVDDQRPRLLLPGFIDSHIHYVQTDVIGSPGRGLLDWLTDFTFPAEQRFADEAHATQVAEFFLDELLRNGTTTALVLGSVHRAATDAFFNAAARRNLRMVAGKVLMDRHCPPALRDDPVSAYHDSSALIERWNGQARLNYAITPRFAITSSPEQLEAVGRLAREHPDVHLHSHLAENHGEIAWMRELFPAARSYLDVYDSYGLLRPRAVYAHCIHLDTTDRQRMAQSGAGAAFCPTSNLFLGSGLFDITACDAAGMRFAMATDVGGGTSFSMLRTLGEAYKVAQLTGQRLGALRAFYLATLAGARLLGLENHIGNLAPGKEADFILLDPSATPLLERRLGLARSLEETLFAFMTLGDDRAIAASYILGERQAAIIPEKKETR